MAHLTPGGKRPQTLKCGRSLKQYLQIHHPEYLVRTYLRYELLETALEHTLAMLRKVSTKFGLHEVYGS